METAFEALARVGFKLKFSFGVDSVNKVFKGGLNPGEIYEIVGESGMGKTQLLMSIAKEYLLSQSRFGVCWIDSNGSFKSRRFLEFDSEKRIDILDRLFVSSVHEPRELIRKLQMLEKNFEQLGCRLLIIDNIGTILNRTAWTLKTGGSDCQKGILSLLTNLVNKRLTVMLSNHLINMDGEDRPSLGRLWGKLISRRIVINRDDRGLFIKPLNAQTSKKGYVRLAERGLIEIDSSSTDTLTRQVFSQVLFPLLLW
ncbi:unnamed protein product [Auanema sp. JU1783]|nr:unnamed protein product [Auanema sp. JU1783]